MTNLDLLNLFIIIAGDPLKSLSPVQLHVPIFVTAGLQFFIG